MITLLLLVRATYMYGVVLHAHPVRGESHINATPQERLQHLQPKLCQHFIMAGAIRNQRI